MSAAAPVGTPTLGVIWPGRPPTASEEHDLRAYLPTSGVALQVVAPPPPAEPPRATLERVLYLRNSREIETLAAGLRMFAPRAIAYACGSASYVGGPGGDASICDRIRAVANAPATTTSTEMLRALRALGANTVAVLSPHIDALNVHLRYFLEGSGVQVVAMNGLGLTHSIEDTLPATIIDLAAAADEPSADVLYIACTSLQTASVIERIEALLDKPVLTANQVTMWGCLRLAGVPAAGTGLGRLFREREG